MKIVDRLTINGDKDPDYRLRVNSNAILNGLVKVISTLFLDAVGGNLYLRTASDKSILGLTATQLREELGVDSKKPGGYFRPNSDTDLRKAVAAQREDHREAKFIRYSK